MATSSSSEDEAKKIGDMFAVSPKKDCPHVKSLVAGIDNISIDMTVPCGVCGNVGENWLCLKCSEVYCSRYVQEHMVHHNTQNPSHEIVLSFSDLSFWCYACDSYIDSPHLESILQAATMAKFDPPTQSLKSVATTETDPPGTSSGKEGEEREPEPEATTQSDPKPSETSSGKEGEERQPEPETTTQSDPKPSETSSGKEGEERQPEPETTTQSDPKPSETSSGKEGEERDKRNIESVDAGMPETPTQIPESVAVGHPDSQLSETSSGKDREEGHGKLSKVTDDQLSKAFHLESSLEREVLLSRMRGTIYGNCIGDAIGLLTEFMTKEEAQWIYGTVTETKWLGLKESKKQIPIDKLELEYYMKHDDFHRSRWEVGDWTDDSDQMILILRTLLDHKGKADILDFVQKFKVWTQTGYKELGDFGGMGIGQTTFRVIMQREFLTDPHKSAYQVWDESGRWAAPNGGVMRTSILGIQDFSHIPTVIHNTRQICKITHADPRCIASCVAVTTAIALMLQGKHRKGDGYDEMAICEEAYRFASEELKTEEEKEELRRHMFAKNLSELELSGDNKIGYTYKCLGAGFWAYRQKDFRLALTKLVMEAGDADTNGAVAGALLGCKLGVEYLPETWLDKLLHKQWLDEQIDRYFIMLGVEERLQQMDLARLASEQRRSRELEKALAAERQAREETERRLHDSEQRSRELETSLAAERQAREETERRLHDSEQRSRELETSLAAERQAREETERRLHNSEQTSRELQNTQVNAHQELEESR